MVTTVIPEISLTKVTIGEAIIYSLVIMAHREGEFLKEQFNIEEKKFISIQNQFKIHYEETITVSEDCTYTIYLNRETASASSIYPHAHEDLSCSHNI